MSQKIKNYTSSVPVERTIGNIEKELVKLGANRIEKTYKDGEPDGIVFSVIIEGAEPLNFRVPARIEEAKIVLADIPEYRNKKKDWIDAQSQRTAWKIVYEWVQIQVSMVVLKQADVMEIFMPYIYNKVTGKTLYNQLSDGGKYRALLE